MSIRIMSTILGERIRLVRPEKIHKHIVYKSDLPQAHYNTRPKTVKKHCGKVVAACLMMEDGSIHSMSTPCTHLDLIEKMMNEVDNVNKTGWQLDNGEYLWR